jgi:hypothetical protein
VWGDKIGFCSDSLGDMSAAKSSLNKAVLPKAGKAMQDASNRRCSTTVLSWFVVLDIPDNHN